MRKYRATFYKEIEMDFEAENSFDASDWCKVSAPLGFITKDYRCIDDEIQRNETVFTPVSRSTENHFEEWYLQNGYGHDEETQCIVPEDCYQMCQDAYMLGKNDALGIELTVDAK